MDREKKAVESSEKLVSSIKLFFALFLAAAVLGLLFYSSIDHSRPLPAEGQTPIESWTVTDPEGNVFTAGSSYRSERKLKGDYTMTSTLPDNIRVGDYLCFVIGGDVEVYIDGELRKDFVSSRDFSVPGGVVKRFYMLTPLGPEDSGAEVKFIRIGTNRRGFIYQQTFVSSLTGFFSFLMSHYSLSFMMAEILFIFSLVLVIVSIALRLLYRRRIEMLYGAMSILIISAWLITNSYLYPFVYGHYHIDGILNYLFCMMMPYNLVFYLDALQKGRYRKVTIGVLITSVVSFILWPALHFSGLFTFPQALLYIDIVLGVQVVIVMGLLLYDAIRKRVKDYRYTAIGYAGFLVCCISEIVILNFLPIMQEDIPMMVGLAFLLVLVVIQQMYDLKRIREEGRKAVDLSEAKTRFLASMSHEIRTPINAVLGMNEMILRENQDPVIGEYARSVKSSGQMLLMLVNDVLDFSKIEAGKMEINEAPYRLSALLKSIMPMLKERADEKELKLNTLILNKVPDGLISDEFRLRQILINLTNNAIKYTDTGSVTIMVGGEEMTPERYLLRMSVRDTGRGISEEGQKHLFEAFNRADLKKNRNIEGTGLGLAIVKSIVDSMNGQIRVTSKEGEGSEFTIMIPVGVSDREPIREDFMQQSTTEVSGNDGCEYRAPEAKILVVDDNRSNLKLVGLFLKRAEIVPDSCDSGRKAIEKCKEQRYDLILLDHMMPELDGMETLRRIKTDEDSKNKEVPVIVLTANAVAGSRQIYLDAGFADYLTKPIDSALLELTIKDYLPEEKILPAKSMEATESSGQPKSLKERLTSIEGLDYETALRYVSGREDLLQEVVNVLVADVGSNVEKMRAAAEAGDMDTYECLAHSVKGQMATIGLASFSEHAKKHEFAAKENNMAYIKEDSEAFFTKYLEICKALVKE